MNSPIAFTTQEPIHDSALKNAKTLGSGSILTKQALKNAQV